MLECGFHGRMLSVRAQLGCSAENRRSPEQSRVGGEEAAALSGRGGVQAAVRPGVKCE